MTTLPLNQINTTPAELARVRPCQDTLTRYIELMQAGEQLPPVTVFHDGETYWLGDGRHRLEARKRVGYTDISVDVRKGTERDAQLYAFSANHAHGLPASQADRKKIARILLDDEEWKTWSDRKIAELSGLSHPTVGKMREALVKFTTPTVPSQTASVATKATTASTSSIEDGAMSESKEQKEFYDPAPDQLSEMVDLVAQLTTDNERLREKIAINSMDIQEEDRVDITEQLRHLRSQIEVAERDNQSLRSSRDVYMNQSSMLSEKLTKIQHVLKRKDSEISNLKQELNDANKRIESLESELDFERATR
jgi:uncharacterized ParB-like nuclease family protein